MRVEELAPFPGRRAAAPPPCRRRCTMHGFPPRSAAARRRPRFPPGEWATDASSSFATNGHESWQLKLYIAMFGGLRLLQSASPVPCLARCPSKRCARCRNGSPRASSSKRSTTASRERQDQARKRRGVRAGEVLAGGVLAVHSRCRHLKPGRERRPKRAVLGSDEVWSPTASRRPREVVPSTDMARSC